jgi:hypothetical protein
MRHNTASITRTPKQWSRRCSVQLGICTCTSSRPPRGTLFIVRYTTPLVSKGACIVLIGVQCVHSLCGPLSVGHAGVSLPLDPRDSHRVLGMATYRRDVCGWNGRSHVIEKVKQVSLSLRDEAAVVVVVVVVVS